MNDALFALTLVTALGCALNAGVFFAFSTFVMAGLRRLPAPQAIAAMQSINVMAPTRAFMTALLGTAMLCVVLAVWALADWKDSFGPYLLAGSALYVAGAIALTMGYHVPRNNSLAALDPQSPEAADRWARYDAEWTSMNHVRAAAPFAAAAALIVAIHLG